MLRMNFVVRRLVLIEVRLARSFMHHGISIVPRMVDFCFVALLFQIWNFVYASVALTSNLFLTRRSFADWIDVFFIGFSTCISIFSVG